MFDEDTRSEPPTAALAQVKLTPDQLLAALGDKHPVFELLTAQQNALTKAQAQVENMVRLVITHAEQMQKTLQASEAGREKYATKFLEMVEAHEALLDGKAAREREDRESEAQQKTSERAINEMMPLLKMVAKQFLGINLAPEELGNGLDDFFESVTDEQWTGLIVNRKLELTEAQAMLIAEFMKAKQASAEAKAAEAKTQEGQSDG